MNLSAQEQDFFSTSATHLAEDDAILIESLVKSPVFGALKRFFKGYRDACYSQLLTATDSNLLIRTQGQIHSLNVLERLPEISTSRRSAKAKAREAEAAAECDSRVRREAYLKHGSQPTPPPPRKKKSVDKP